MDDCSIGMRVIAIDWGGVKKSGNIDKGVK